MTPTRRVLHHLCALSVLTVASCAVHNAPAGTTPGGAGTQAAAAGAPQHRMTEAEVDAAMSRENANLAPAKVASGDWKLEVLSAGPVSIISQNGKPAIDVPLGSDSAARCILLDADADVMGGLVGGLTSVKQQSQDALKKVMPSPLAVAQEAPVMFVSAIYANGPEVGLFKFALHAHPQHPVLCLQEGLGFMHTFQTATMRLFETLERGQPAPPPQLVEVARITVDGLDWGFTRTTIQKNAEAAWVQDNDTALLVPRAASEFASATEFSEELIDSHGRLVRGAWAKAEGKTLLHKVNLSARDKRGTYDYEGEVGGKPVKGELHSRDPRGGVASSLASVLRLRGLAAKPAAFDIKQEEYSPSDDPAHLVETRYVRAKTDPAGQLRIVSGGRELGAMLDADGRTHDVTFKAGTSTIHIERIFARGKL